MSIAVVTHYGAFDFIQLSGEVCKIQVINNSPRAVDMYMCIRDKCQGHVVLPPHLYRFCICNPEFEQFIRAREVTVGIALDNRYDVVNTKYRYDMKTLQILIRTKGSLKSFNVGTHGLFRRIYLYNPCEQNPTVYKHCLCNRYSEIEDVD